MNQPLTIPQALLAVAVCALIVFATRLFPFALFARRKPPRLLHTLSRYLPPMMMAVLLTYCFKDTDFTTAPHGLPAVVALVLTVALHLWKRNAMLSIFAGTGLYMLLIQVLQ